MFTGFQKILAACIGHTEEETDQPDDVQRDDESQTESEITTDDNSVDTTEPTDTTVSEHTETEDNDVPPPLEESPPADEVPTVPVAESAETLTDSDPGPVDETTEPDRDEVSGEMSDAAPSDADDPPQSSDAADPISEEDAVPDTELVSPEQETEDSPQVADSEVPETETEETDESENTEAEPERPASELGIIEEVYDFVEMFEQSTVSGTEQASASGIDRSGGVTKPAIFEHPTPTEAAKIDYTVSLPDVADQEKLFLHFSVGLRDGVVFGDEARQPGGVKFAIEIFDLHNNSDLEVTADRCFEAVSTECRWQENGIELTHYAGREIVVSFLTECNVTGNSNYAWALWGKPQLRKLKQSDLRKRKRDAEPELRCGIAILHYSDERTQFLEFNEPTSTAVSALTDICIESAVSEEPPIKVSLYTALPKLEIVSVGATAAIVAAGEDFEIQCTLRNIGTAPLGRADEVRLSINGVKLRRGRPRQTVRELEPGEETSVYWVARRFSHSTVVAIAVSLKCQTAAGEARDTGQGSVAIRPTAPKLESKIVKELHTYTVEGGSVVIGNKNLRVVFVRGA
ncbi:hypothetical protein J5I95_14475, partial [Candidatus Poribacteria bacterium]|nr:hypothetical protein [Candidatus Poribacteria bacterium]